MNRATKTAQVTLPSDTEVRVSRDFAAPRTLVWQAPASDRDHRRLWQLTPAEAHRLAECPAPVSR